MKKILAIMLAIVLCMSMLTGCGSNTRNTDVIGSSDAVEENTESSVEDASVGTEEDMTGSENVTASEEESEIAEEKVIFSADEVMTHIDSLIAQYIYNDPEHIKALVIAANLDYISEEDLNTILTEYGYTMEELSALYIEEGGPLYSAAMSYYNTNHYHFGVVDSLSDGDRYANRITLESVMLNDKDKEFAKEVDGYLIAGSELDNKSSIVAQEYENYEAITSGEKLVVSYVDYMYGFDCEYNPFNDYLSMN